MVILDTNIVIDHLRQPGKKSHLETLLQKLPQQTFAISVISVQELYEGQSTKNKNQEDNLLAILSPLKILPYNYDVAELAGRIIRDAKHPMVFADAAIAATAIINGSQLFTLDKKVFSKIKGLNLL